MATATALLTAEEYVQLPDNGQRTELVRGRIVPLNMPYPRDGEICAKVVGILWQYLADHDIGRPVCNDSGVITERDPDTVRGQDVGYYSYERAPKGPLPRRYLDVAPELVFEVRSKGDSWSEILIKAGEYLAAGVLVVCVLDEQKRTCTVYRQDDSPVVIGEDEELTLPDILADFHVKVRRFFE